MDIHLAQQPVLVLVFGMEGCPACSDYLPVFRRVAEKFPSVPAYAIDCNKQSEVADRFKVRATPTTFLLKHGRVVRRIEGEVGAAEIERLFRGA